ncbi:MAG: WXG100 family type VII secretion target [bacterium]|nr:WXG100 family type VII secretion target [bacterium]
MANAKISMDPDQIVRYGKKIVSEASDYKDQVKKIYDIVDDLNRTWTGTAASRFTTNINGFKKEYNDFGKLIEDFGNLLLAIGKDYQNLEKNL